MNTLPPCSHHSPLWSDSSALSTSVCVFQEQFQHLQCSPKSLAICGHDIAWPDALQQKVTIIIGQEYRNVVDWVHGSLFVIHLLLGHGGPGARVQWPRRTRQWSGVCKPWVEWKVQAWMPCMFGGTCNLRVLWFRMVFIVGSVCRGQSSAASRQHYCMDTWWEVTKWATPLDMCTHTMGGGCMGQNSCCGNTVDLVLGGGLPCEPPVSLGVCTNNKHLLFWQMQQGAG